MIKSRNFWIAASCLALLPWLAVDIAEHRLDWNLEVREPLINVVQEIYTFSKAEKAVILDRVFERNGTLLTLIYLKGFVMVLLAGLSLYFFRRFRKKHQPKVLRPALLTASLLAVVLAARLFLPHPMDTAGIRILPQPASLSSLEQLHQEKYRGKMLYVDFWGTTCGSCLEEFRNFTSPLKAHYRQAKDIAYLYIAQGNEYLWRKQIQKYKVEGEHLYLSDADYALLYHHLAGDTTQITMPRYAILDKSGRVVESDAKRPSDRAALFSQLDKYLAP